MLYIVVLKSPDRIYTLSDESSLIKFIDPLILQRTSFKVYPVSTSNEPVRLDTWYEPQYQYLEFDTFEVDPKYSAEYKHLAHQMVWFRNGIVFTPPWFVGEERKHHEQMVLPIQEMARQKEKKHRDFLGRTYTKAPDIGLIDSLEQFEKRFPNDNPNTFDFIRTGREDLIKQYGDYKIWHKSSPINYYGNVDIYSERDLMKFPDTLYLFRREASIKEPN